MEEGTHFNFDVVELATLAASIVEKDLRDENHGIMPDDLYLPRDFHDPKQYSDAMITLMYGIERAMQQIVEVSYPKMHITKYRISSDEQMEIMAWRVFQLLKMAPPGGVDDETLIPVAYAPIELPPEYGTGGYINMDHPRVLPLVSENRQEEYNALTQRIRELLYDRPTLLEEFFDAKNRQDRKYASSCIEKSGLELDLLRRDFIVFCKKYDFQNIFMPPPEEEKSDFYNAIYWSDTSRQEEALESFIPSLSETALLPYMPKTFQQYELSLFRFTFDSQADIDQRGIDPEEAFQEDMRRMVGRKYERKMLIAYHARLELMLAKRGRSGLNTRDISTIKESFLILKQEIEECRRKLASRAVAPTEEPTDEGQLITHDISEVGTLAATADNILKKAHLHGGDPEVLGIIGQIGSVLYECFSGASKVRTDDDFSDYDKGEIIEAYRHDAIRKLHDIQHRLSALSIDDEALDRADRIVVEALQHLSQY